MELIAIVIRGVVQGLTEFLPISSSGHLVVTESLLQATGCRPLPDVVQINLALHLGTLLAVLLFYSRQVRRLVRDDRRVISLLIVGTLPAILVAMPLKLAAPPLLGSPLLAGCMFPVSGALLIWASELRPGALPYGRLSYLQVLVIGLFQALAILPGISRSGVAIAAGLAVGLDRQSSATFAFLLAIPTIAGAGTLELLDLLGASSVALPLSSLVVATALSFLAGLVALWWLIAWVRQGRLVFFAYWCIPLGITFTAWQLGKP